jgi:hypothetical protein
MKGTANIREPFDREVQGAVVEAHGVIVTPVARVRGMADARNEERARWRFAWAAIRPAKMIVRDRVGQTREVKLAPTEGQALGAMAVIGLTVAAATLLISLFARKGR